MTWHGKDVNERWGLLCSNPAKVRHPAVSSCLGLIVYVPAPLCTRSLILSVSVTHFSVPLQLIALPFITPSSFAFALHILHLFHALHSALNLSDMSAKAFELLPHSNFVANDFAPLVPNHLKHVILSTSDECLPHCRTVGETEMFCTFLMLIQKSK